MTVPFGMHNELPGPDNFAPLDTSNDVCAWSVTKLGDCWKVSVNFLNKWNSRHMRIQNVCICLWVEIEYFLFNFCQKCLCTQSQKCFCTASLPEPSSSSNVNSVGSISHLPCDNPAVGGFDLPGGHFSRQARPPALYEWYSISSWNEPKMYSPA